MLGSTFNKPVSYPLPLWVPDISQSSNSCPHPKPRLGFPSIAITTRLGSTQAGGVHHVCSAISETFIPLPHLCHFLLLPSVQFGPVTRNSKHSVSDHINFKCVQRWTDGTEP